MTDTRFRPLARDQYHRIILTGTMPGYTSPMDTDANYASLIAVTKADDMDPRWPLAFTWAEGHHGSDPGLVAARFNNLGGVKFVGQPGAYDTHVAADTGGTYAGFPDLTGYWREFVRIMHNAIIGPHYAAGDLVQVVEHYTNGPGTGHNKIDQYNAYWRDYPPEGASNVVTGADIIAKARTYLGQPNSDGIDGNGWHPWALWCEAFAEAMPRSLGLVIPRMGTAVGHGRSLSLTGGTPAHGAWVFFDERFYSPDGHVGFWDAEHGALLGTVTDGTGISYRAWGPGTVGYMGWAMPDGAQSEQPVPPGWITVDGQLLGPGFAQMYLAVPEAFDTRKRTYGVLLKGDHDATLVEADARKVPVVAAIFERLTLVWDKGATPDPWSVRAILATEEVT